MEGRGQRGEGILFGRTLLFLLKYIWETPVTEAQTCSSTSKQRNNTTTQAPI